MSVSWSTSSRIPTPRLGPSISMGHPGSRWGALASMTIRPHLPSFPPSRWMGRHHALHTSKGLVLGTRPLVFTSMGPRGQGLILPQSSPIPIMTRTLPRTVGSGASFGPSWRARIERSMRNITTAPHGSWTAPRSTATQTTPLTLGSPSTQEPPTWVGTRATVRPTTSTSAAGTVRPGWR